MALNIPTSGQLLSLDIVDGGDAVATAKKLLESRSPQGGFSTWDASGIFFEMNGLDVNDRPSPRTLVLLYAADLFFRLRWEIVPALEEGKCVVAVPYIETGYAFGVVSGLPKAWLTEVFRFAPKANEHFRANGTAAAALGAANTGFVEYCSSVANQDLRPKFDAYFADMERRGECRSI